MTEPATSTANAVGASITGGATLTLQVKGCDGTTAHTVGTDTTFTATGSNGFKLEAGCEIRMAVSAGSPSALYVSAYRI